jgi:PBP1b-binding outer membrane lipoprotein LpoB
MKYGLLALLAIAIIPGCSCLRKDSRKKEKKEKKMRAPKRLPIEQMPSAPMDYMAMQPEMEIQEEEIDVMPDMEPMEMPVQEDMMPEMLEMGVEEENIQF